MSVPLAASSAIRLRILDLRPHRTFVPLVSAQQARRGRGQPPATIVGGQRRYKYCSSRRNYCVGVPFSSVGHSSPCTIGHSRIVFRAILMEPRILTISSYAKTLVRFPAATSASGEQRRAVRYPLSLRAVYRWRDRGLSRQAEGVTRDVSARGAYVVSADCPPEGSKVEIRLSVSSGRRGRSPVWLDAEGSVSRVDEPPSGRKRGFAIESDGPRFFTR